MADSWCTIESDPGVFTELIEKIGVRGLQVEEVYSMDDETFAGLDPIYGFIFLFKYDSDLQRSNSANGTTEDPATCPLFFAQQVINNACATQAIISILLNLDPSIDIGDTLGDYKAFAADMSPELRGLALSNQDVIKSIHNSFSRPEPFIMESVKATKDDDVYHFVSYLPADGSLYELDGLQEGPINHGPVGDSWLTKARQVITQRIELYASSEIRFNLLAVVKNRRDIYVPQIMEKKATLAAALAAAAAASPPAHSGFDTDALAAAAAVGDDLRDAVAARGLPDPTDPAWVNGGDPLSDDPDVLASLLAILPGEIAVLASRIAEETQKFDQWHLDNIRRKHNYVPFIMAMLKTLASKGELIPLVDAAR